MSHIEQMEAEINDHTDKMAIARKVVEEYENTMKYGNSAEQAVFWNIRSKHGSDCYRIAVDQEDKEREKEEQKKTEKYPKLYADEVGGKIAGSVFVTLRIHLPCANIFMN